MMWKRIFFDNPLVLLDQFAEYANEGSLKRLPYKIWRNIKSYFIDANKENCQVGFEYDEDGNILMGTSKRDVGNYDPVIVEGIQTDDSSFGLFIAELLDGRNLPRKESGPIFIECPKTVINYTSSKNEAAPLWDTLTELCERVRINDRGEIFIDSSMSDARLGSDSTTNNANRVASTVYTKNETDNIIERESNNMKFNFDFGTCENDNVRVSPYGIAIKNAAGTWVSYDAKTGNIIDVDIFNFNGGKYLFKMPVAVKDVKAGDIVIHNRVACFVKGVTDGTVIAIDPYAGEEKSILFTKTPFGFDFVTKVVCLFDNLFTGASNDNPFGNMLPFFLMSNSDSKSGKGNMDPLMMAMLLGGNSCGGLQNPIMLALMCADQTNMNDVLPLMMLANQNNSFLTPASK